MIKLFITQTNVVALSAKGIIQKSTYLCMFLSSLSPADSNFDPPVPWVLCLFCPGKGQKSTHFRWCLLSLSLLANDPKLQSPNHMVSLFLPRDFWKDWNSHWWFFCLVDHGKDQKMTLCESYLLSFSLLASDQIRNGSTICGFSLSAFKKTS